MRKLAIALTPLLILALVVGAIGCGGDDEETPTPTCTTAPTLSPEYPSTVTPITASTPVPDTEPVWQEAPIIIAGDIYRGEEKSHELPISDTTAARFTLFWLEHDELSLTLNTPSGKLIIPSDAETDPNIIYRKAYPGGSIFTMGYTEVYVIENLEQGIWTMNVRATNVPEDGVRYRLNIYLKTHSLTLMPTPIPTPTSTTSPIPTSTTVVSTQSPAIENTTDILKLLHTEWEYFQYTDVEQLRTDNDLRLKYDQSFGSIEGMESPSFFSEGDIEWMIQARTPLTILGVSILYFGSHSPDNIRKIIHESEEVEDTLYLGTEIWITETSFMTFAAGLINNTMVMGTLEEVRQYIDVVTGRAQSLYDNHYLRDVISRLPKGITIVGRTGDNWVAYGMSWEKITSETIQLTQVAKWKDSASAQDNLAFFRRSIESSEDMVTGDPVYSNIEVVQEDQILTMTATAPVSHLDKLP